MIDDLMKYYGEHKDIFYDRLESALRTARNEALEEAAAWVRKRLANYDAEHGYTDPDTGTREYPGTGDEYVGELQEIEEGICDLKHKDGQL